MNISSLALDELRLIAGGPMFIGLLDQDGLIELEMAGLVTTVYEGEAALTGMGVALVTDAGVAALEREAA